jgi:hypothetical protein
MDLSQPQPVCLRCKNGKTKPDNTPIALLDIIKSLPQKMKTFMKIGICSASFILLAASTYLYINYKFAFLYFPSALAIIGGIILFRLLHSTNTKINKKMSSEKFTLAQVDTVLRINDGRITPRQLASATNASEDMAKDFLKKLAIEGKLAPVINSDGIELTYKRDMWNLP